MIAIIDYQMGNLRSVQKGFEHSEHEATITGDPMVISKADKLVLPGVGAFADAISEVRRRELEGPIREAIESGKPFLGICLGLQMLFDRSYERGRSTRAWASSRAKCDALIFRPNTKFRTTKFRTWGGTRSTTEIATTDLRGYRRWHALLFCTQLLRRPSGQRRRRR